MTLGRVRALERLLVLERAEAVVPPIVYRYVDEWEPDNPDYSLELAVRVSSAGITLPSHDHARTYLERCHRANKVPDPKHLTYALLPWTASI